MAGVIQEIDLVLSQQALRTLEADLNAVGTKLGTGIAAAATPAARDFATKLVDTIRQQLATGTADLAKQLADGVLNEQQFATKAAALGKEISGNLAKGIGSGSNLRLFEGEGGAALKGQLDALNTSLQQTATEGVKAAASLKGLETQQQRNTAATNAQVEASRRVRQQWADLVLSTQRVEQTTRRAGPSMNTLRNGLVGVALAATGTAGPLGRVVSTLLLFAGGGGFLLTLAAIIGGIALAFNKLTESTTKARESTEKLIDRFKDVGRTRLTGVQQISQDIREVEKDIAAVQERLANAQVKTGVGLFLQTIAETFTGSIKKDTEQLNKLLDVLKDLTANRAQEAAQAAEGLATSRSALIKELDGIARAASGTATAAIVGEIGAVKERFQEYREEAAKLGQSVPAGLVKAFDTAIAALDQKLGATTVGEDIARRMADIEISVVEGLGSEALQNIVSQIDALRANLDAVVARMPEGAARTQLEEQRNALIARRNELQQQGLEIATTENLIFTGQVEDQAEAVKKVGVNWEKVGDTIATVAQGLLDMAHGLGLVDEGTEKVLQGVISIGKNLPGALSGDPGSIFGVVSGVIGAVGGLVRGSKDPERLARNEELFQQAIRGDQGALQDLQRRSQGLATAKAREDADRKYIEAQESLARSAEQAANSVEGLARRSAEAADVLAKQREVVEQRADLSDITDPRRIAEQRAMMDRLRVPALGFLGGDFGTDEGRDAMENEIRRLFEAAPNLSIEQRGGLSPEAFRAMLVDWEHLLDEIAANEATHRENLLDERRQQEEAKVEQMREREAREEWADLFARGGKAGQEASAAVLDAARLIRAAEAAEGAGPLGKDSPLAREARRRADEAVAEARRAVEEGEARLALPEEVSPGFTVQRTLTESSAGRIVGEMITQTTLQTEMRDLLAEIAGHRQVGAAAAGGRVVEIVVPVQIDGREIARSTGRYQYSDLQQASVLQGNASVGG